MSAIGGSCVTIKAKAQEPIKTLETRLGPEALRKSDLEVAADLLPPGVYIFTLEVSKAGSNQRAEANATVTIVTGNVPRAEIIALDSIVAPHQKFVAAALITGEQGTCVWWENVVENGFASLDMTRTSKSSKRKCYSKKNEGQPFYLTLKKGLLQPGVEYKFRVNTMSPDGAKGSSSLIIETLEELNLPSNINFEVSKLTYISHLDISHVPHSVQK